MFLPENRAKIGDHKNVLLFATPSGKPLYESYGFHAASNVYQHQAIVNNGNIVEPTLASCQRQITPADHSTIARLAVFSIEYWLAHGGDCIEFRHACFC